MDISWYGLSCFRLTERNMVSVVTDPYRNKGTGLGDLKVKGDVVTVSHPAPGHDAVKNVSGHNHVFDGPGEYEIGGVFITGIATPPVADRPRNVLFLFDYNGVKVAHFGDVGKVPNQAQMEALELVNVLLLPVGGGNSLNASQAAEIVSMIEPNIVVPMHYAQPGLKFELDGVERFLQEMGVTDVTEENSLRVSSSRLPEETQVVLLASKAG